jgi:hypothetical protein
MAEQSAQRDCREPSNLWGGNQFTVRATNVNWKTERGQSRLTLELSIQNISNGPLNPFWGTTRGAVSGGGVYQMEVELLNDKGATFSLNQAATMSGAGSYNEDINPGMSVSKKFVFDVPKDNYTLAVVNHRIDTGGSRTTTCRISA